MGRSNPVNALPGNSGHRPKSVKQGGFIMKHTMLTTDTLTRFEKEININFLTPETTKEIEHFAYCANMGAENKDAAWKWFRHLVANKFQILLSE